MSYPLATLSPNSATSSTSSTSASFPARLQPRSRTAGAAPPAPSRLPMSMPTPTTPSSSSAASTTPAAPPTASKAQLAQHKEALADTTLQQASRAALPPLPKAAQLRVRRTLKGHLAKVYALQWAADSRHIVSVGQDGKLLVWDAYTSNKVHVLPLQFQWVMDCAYSPSGRLVATGGLENVCYVFRLPSIDDPPSESLSAYAAKPARELVGHTAFMSHCRFLSDREMVTSSGDSTCMLWDIETGRPKAEYAEHAADVMALALNPVNRSLFVSGACDGYAKLWDTRIDGAKGSVQSFHAHDMDINAICMFPDGNAVVTGSEDTTCKLFDLRADRALATYASPANSKPVTALDLTHSGRILAVAHDDPHVLLWDTLHAQPLTPLAGHENRVSSLGVSPDGQALATGSWDARLLVWAV